MVGTFQALAHFFHGLHSGNIRSAKPATKEVRQHCGGSRDTSEASAWIT